MPKVNWQEINFLTTDSVTHEVAGRDFEYYPIRMRRLTKVRKVLSSLARNISAVFQDDSLVQGRKETEHQGSTMVEVFPMELNTVRDRRSARQQAWGGLTEAVTDQENMIALAGVIMDALRDEFEDFDEGDQKTFVEHVTLPHFVQHLIGVAKANKSLFGSMADGVEGKAKGVLTKLVEEQDEEPLPPTQSSDGSGSASSSTSETGASTSSGTS